ncbi:MAG: nucleotide exchange factor GrpE [Clostridia bacterium]|nr:nucleotide exchange factor GrpE [Clostridia bacterium]
MAKKKNEEEILQNEENTQEEAEVVEEATENPLEKELEALNDKYLRLVAEYDNYRKRTAKEKEAIYPEAKVSVISSFLPVLDNLERALATAGDDPVYEGVKMISKQFAETLKAAGVEEIPALGEKFDPNFHNAVMHVDDEDFGENEIVEEFQKGYKMGERIIRYSMVKVAN